MQHTKLDVDFDGPSEPFFSKMYAFFAAKETYLDIDENPYADATGSENPFNNGRPTENPLRITRTVKDTRDTITATFHPTRPTDICRAWNSLATYCGDGGNEDCACYSGSYYVPDQWNSLAAGCAVLTSTCTSTEDVWCQMGQSAASLTDYCTEDAAAVKFAVTANIAPADATTTDDSDPPSNNAPTATDDAPTTTQTSNGDEPSDSSPIPTHTLRSTQADIPLQVSYDSASSPHYFFGPSPTGSAPTTASSSSRALDSVTAIAYSRIFFVITLMFLFRDCIVFLN
jgi:hypothetical protein